MTMTHAPYELPQRAAGAERPLTTRLNKPDWRPERRVLDELAVVLSHPEPETAKRARRLALLLEPSGDAAAWRGALAEAVREIGERIRDDYEAAVERYTRLFDLMPLVTLNMGHHLFGDRYERGVLLAGLRQELREAGVPECDELPDFLPTLLRLATRLPVDDDGNERFAMLLEHVLLPSLARIRVATQHVDDPYLTLLAKLAYLVAPAELLARPASLPSQGTWKPGPGKGNGGQPRTIKPTFPKPVSPGASRPNASTPDCGDCAVSSLSAAVETARWKRSATPEAARTERPDAPSRLRRNSPAAVIDPRDASSSDCVDRTDGVLDDASIDSAAIEPVSLPNEAPREPRDGAISSQSASSNPRTKSPTRRTS